MHTFAKKPNVRQPATIFRPTRTAQKHEANALHRATRTDALPRQTAAASAGLQTELKLGMPGDVHEQEADRVAEQVMRMPGPSMQSRAAADISGHATPAVRVQTKSTQAGSTQAGDNGSAAARGSVHDVLRSTGQPLDPATRAFMEPRFGQDFSHVRVHTDAKAGESAAAINARAYAVGHDVVFGSNEYSPATNTGRQVLAHELTHTVQQSPHSGETASSPQRIMRLVTPFAEVTSQGDVRTLFIRGESRFRVIKQILAAADVLLEGSPSKDNIQSAHQKGKRPSQYYVGKVSTTGATKASVKKLLNALVAEGGQAFAENDEFTSKLKLLLDAFHKDHPNTASNLQVQSIISQGPLKVNDHNSCIEVMNKCIENLYGSEKLKKENLSDKATGTIEKLSDKRLVTAQRTVGFKYVGTGRFQIRPNNFDAVTKFTDEKFHTSSFADALTDMTKNKEDGFYVNACSLFNAYHSIIVIVKKNKGKFRFVWKDQDKADEMTAAQLNSELMGYAAGRYSWWVRKKYEEVYHVSVTTYDEIPDGKELRAIEASVKTSVIKDLNLIIIASLKP